MAFSVGSDVIERKRRWAVYTNVTEQTNIKKTVRTGHERGHTDSHCGGDTR